MPTQNEKRRMVATDAALLKPNYCKPDSSPIPALIKPAIVRLAVWGLIPAGFASWLLKVGGLKNV